MKSTSFEDLIAWQKVHQFTLAVYRLTKLFPKDEIYGLTSQFRRAAVSISANIAEGYKKRGKADKLRFMNISQASLEECRYYLILSKDLEYIDQNQQLDMLEILNKSSYLLNKYCLAMSNDIQKL